jgi:hypothetical protein
VANFEELHAELVLGLGLLVFLAAAGMVGSWKR